MFVVRCLLFDANTVFLTISIPESGGKRGRWSPAKTGKDKRKENASRDGRNRGKASLRVGTGRRGRSAAEISARRGSLKRKDRSAQKAAKAEAALERKTVNLPE